MPDVAEDFNAGYVLHWHAGWAYMPSVYVAGFLVLPFLVLVGIRLGRVLLPVTLVDSIRASFAVRRSMWRYKKGNLAVQNLAISVAKWITAAVGLAVLYGVGWLCLSIWVYPNLLVLTSQVDKDAEEMGVCTWMVVHYEYYLEADELSTLASRMESGDREAQHSQFIREYSPAASGVIPMSDVFDTRPDPLMYGRFLTRGHTGVWYLADAQGKMLPSLDPYRILTVWEEDSEGRGVQRSESAWRAAAGHCTNVLQFDTAEDATILFHHGYSPRASVR